MNTAYQNRNFHGSQCPGRKSWTITDKLLEAQSLGGPGVQGWGPPLLCFTSRGSTRFSQQISEKNPLLIATEDKKRNHFEKCQNTLFFLGRSAFKGNYLTRVRVLFLKFKSPIFKDEIIPISYNLFQNIEEEGILPNSYSETGISLIPKSDGDITRKGDHRPAPS